MESSKIIKKIRYYSIISVLLPLITINSCFLLYKFLGDTQTYIDIPWEKKRIEIPIEKWSRLHPNLQAYTYTNCPKYIPSRSYLTKDNKIVEMSLVSYADANNLLAIIERGEVINTRCIKNNKFVYLILNNFQFLEKLLIKAQINNKTGFSSIKNPYLYGEVSISRTARYFPATYIFKPFIIITAIFLFLYWKNNLNLFNYFRNKNILGDFSNKFFYFGAFSCIFLILHATFLGLEFESKLFSQIRRLIIILFIVFEVLAQIFLTKNLFKFKNNLQKNIHSPVLVTKITFVSIVALVTLVSFTILAFFEPGSNFKHMLEWNYFSFLLFYYILSRFLWKTLKP
tara:strand:+ start:312 stop:1337 length:1026 start_codon:yes stop_codon:yes gene_type:complete